MAGTKDEKEMAILYIVLSRLMTEVKETDAYSLGLIDNKYKIIRDPETDEEHEALSPLWLFIFKLKRALGTRLLSLFKYMYLKNYTEDGVLSKISLIGAMKTRSEIKQVEREFKNTYRSLKQ
jgi:hypothetical protein